MEPITVIFSANDKFAMLLGVVLCSIFENKKGNYPIRVFVIDGGISAQNKERLKVLEERHQFEITYIRPDKGLFKGILIGNKAIELPIETYYRAAVARILPAGYHKAIYLDCDVVVRGDIKELFDADLGGKTIGAVADRPQDARIAHMKKMYRVLRAPVPERIMYFNAGVLLIDLDRWRILGIEEKLFAFMRDHPEVLVYHDQDAMNFLLSGDCTELPSRYNLLAEHARGHDRDPLIVHYAGGGKAWYLLSALPYQQDYVYYANKTPWKNKKYRKLMDVSFAKKYHVYAVAWGIWGAYKKTRSYFKK